MSVQVTQVAMSLPCLCSMRKGREGARVGISRMRLAKVRLCCRAAVLYQISVPGVWGVGGWVYVAGKGGGEGLDEWVDVWVRLGTWVGVCVCVSVSVGCSCWLNVAAASGALAPISSKFPSQAAS